MRGFGSPGRATFGGVLLVGAVLLGGCTSDAPEGSGTGSVTATGSPSAASPSASGTPAPAPSWSGTETLSPEQLQAFEEATQTVLAYRQTIVDLYSGARDDLNDLYFVATGEMLDQNLRQIQGELGKGFRVEPEGAELQLVAAEPLEIRLKDSPPTMRIRACIDASGLSVVGASGPQQGVQEQLDYTLVQVANQKPSGWAVKQVQANDDVEARKC